MSRPAQSTRCPSATARRNAVSGSASASGPSWRGANLGYQTWAVTTHLLLTNLKSVSSVKLHRDLNINQKSVWLLAHRLRETFDRDASAFGGPVETDESYMGGRRKKAPKAKRATMNGCGTVGKSVVIGVKDRGANEVWAKVVPSTDIPTLQGFVRGHTEPRTMIYTDEVGAYHGLTRDYGHKAVNHGVDKYVHGQAHTQGIESFRSMLKRAHKGTFDKIRAPSILIRMLQSSRPDTMSGTPLDRMARVAFA